ncbi:hypothetical protein [Streptomyces sp. MMG1121]|uniref:hypothetical protein n=1 Tax=Streptomyces sp. MMG1121 TaxID=1415544 RepID=UPI0006AE5A7C|nr:hypothetical protein [Streptomyces sp. MMG1121]KOV61166.1 hypothetical protein ADK64_28670 [Streptomyces sp. MMG1121]
MVVDQLPSRVREFAGYLDGLLARLDPREGWSGVFWQRDPDGMRACLDGREVPPWDVVDALLQDLAAVYGSAAADAERERARALYRAALDAYDARPGARETLADRLDVMLREQRYAADRQAELARLLSADASGADSDAHRLDLAWARDDHARASARCAELRARLAELDRRVVAGEQAAGARGWPTAGRGHVAAGPGTGGESGPVREPVPAEPGPARSAAPPTLDTPHTPPVPTAAVPASPPTSPTPEPSPAPVTPATPAGARKRRRGSARFAGMAEDVGAPVAVPRAAVRPPRGARFARGADEAVEAPPVRGEEADGGAGVAVAGAVERLARLRADGRTGEAHVLLVEVARWAPARFPLLADALRRAGLGADWATLLWEAASLPVERLVGVADALAAAGRDADGRQLLRQGVARPAEQVGVAVLRLADEGRRREAGALLDACVRVRTAEEAARAVGPEPRRLVPLLLAAARAVSEERYWDVVHALRVVGHTP